MEKQGVGNVYHLFCERETRGDEQYSKQRDECRRLLREEGPRAMEWPTVVYSAGCMKHWKRPSKITSIAEMAKEDPAEYVFWKWSHATEKGKRSITDLMAFTEATCWEIAHFAEEERNEKKRESCCGIDEHYERNPDKFGPTHQKRLRRDG
jgi:hypothetical protein